MELRTQHGSWGLSEGVITCDHHVGEQLRLRLTIEEARPRVDDRRGVIKPATADPRHLFHHRLGLTNVELRAGSWSWAFAEGLRVYNGHRGLVEKSRRRRGLVDQVVLVVERASH